MDLSDTGRGNEGSGAGGGVDIRNPPPEYCCPVYIATQPILYLCLEADQRLKAGVSMI